MAKTDIPFTEIALHRAWAKPSTPAWLSNTKVNGWDTETSRGRIVTLSYAWDGERGRVDENGGKPLDPSDVFVRLTNRRARGACNVWYNLDFDANVILSALPRNVVYHISLLGSDTWNGYHITYLRGKLLSIRDPFKHKVEHFDVAHIFFQTGGNLDGALQAWQGRRKRNELVDVTQFDNLRYLRKHWKQICDYACSDAEDVRDVWKAFASVAEPLEIPCARPYSTGYLAEQRYNVEFRKPGKRKPSFVNRELQEFAWTSYRGGRFEVIERGTVDDVVSYDINSAYPNVLRTLPDPGTLWWHYYRNPSFAKLETAHYGFVRAVVTTDPTRPLQPFAIRREGRLSFPVLDLRSVTVTLPEFLFAVRSGIVTSFHVSEAWCGMTDEHTVFPFDFIDGIYRKRQELKKAGNTKAQAVLKIIINSMYGKLAQLTRSLERTRDGAKWQKSWTWQPIELFPAHMRGWLESEGIEIHQTVRAGAYFNPILASYVTGLTRLQLLQTAVENGLESDTVLLATDSLTFRTRQRKELPCDVVHNSALGAWSLDARGSLFVVGSGVYELTEADGTVKTRTRGFEPGIGVYAASLGGTSLREAARSAHYDDERHEHVIPISNKRPLKIPQAVWQNLDLHDVGVFKEVPRGLSAGMDRKRLWPKGRHVSYDDLLCGAERSEPLRLHRGA